MKPTVGRIVHYNHQYTERHPIEAHAAIVAAVNANGSVNLAVFTDNGIPYSLQDVHEGTERGTWQWPPRAS